MLKHGPIQGLHLWHEAELIQCHDYSPLGAPVRRMVQVIIHEPIAIKQDLL